MSSCLIMSALGLFLLILAASFCPGECMFIKDSLGLRKHTSQTSDMCSECSHIIQLSANMISSKDHKEHVYETLHALCQHLPDKDASECDSQMKMYLPKMLRRTLGQKEVKATCSAFRLCPTDKDEEEKLSQDGTVKAALTNTHPSEQFNPACTLCLYIIKKLETMLPQNMTEDALMKLMGEVCDLLPQSYKAECDEFVDKYGVQIVEFLLSSAAPHTICALLHVCWFKDLPAPEVPVPLDCESCHTLALLSRLQLGLNATQPQTSTFLQSVCGQYPNAIPKCEAFTRIYGSRLQQVLGNQAEYADVCERADLCSTKKSDLLGSNPCTWGPSFWCKDSDTAQKCGNLAFCEKHVWKK
ncbi:surfactant protein Bb isoform X4 [Nerophis ophidion]|uniref:surfactant protein Bb isoform X4 n=1 Tax=Nerophis ophidion TaxID=159077 RepID=UPI002ADF9DC6|nr:surfactant protein Bb isoform X4 [Nerophis ophidion]